MVGAGFGGLAMSLRLRRLGYNVSVLDNNPKAGGRAQVYELGDYKFDAGPTVITAPFLFDELFELFGKKRSDYVDFLRVEPWYRFEFADGSKLDYGGQLEDTIAEIDRISPGERSGYQKLVAFSKKIFAVGFEKLADQPFHRFQTMMKQVPALMVLKSYLSVYSLVSSFLRDDRLRRAFSIHPLLVGGNPFTTTSIYGLILYLEKKWGIHYSMGGTGNIIKGFEKLMDEEEIEVIKGHEVTKIISDKKKITGVQLNDQTIINCNNVICNADPPAVYEKMLNGNTNNSFLFKWKKNRMEYSMGLFVYYFGTKKKYENVEHHTIKFGNKYKEHLDDIFNKKKLNDDISYYLHRPSSTDKSMAPEGNDCFYVLVPVPNNQSNIDWSIEGEKMKNLVIDKMQNDLMPNLKENIVEDFYLTPDYFEKDLNTKHGSGFSIQPKFSQSAYFRFHNKSEVYDGLYFVGAGTHPGAGVPGVLSSAKVLDKII